MLEYIMLCVCCTLPWLLREHTAMVTCFNMEGDVSVPPAACLESLGSVQQAQPQQSPCQSAQPGSPQRQPMPAPQQQQWTVQMM